MQSWSPPVLVQDMWTIYFLKVKQTLTVNGLNGEHILNGDLQRLPSSGHPSLGFAMFQALNASFSQEEDEKDGFKAWKMSFSQEKGEQENA